MGGVGLCIFKKKKQLIFTLGKALSNFNRKKKLGCFSPMLDGSYNGAFTLDIKLVLSEVLYI